MIKHISAGLFYVAALLQFALVFGAEEPGSHLVWGWVFWALGTVVVVWDLLTED